MWSCLNKQRHHQHHQRGRWNNNAVTPFAIRQGITSISNLSCLEAWHTWISFHPGNTVPPKLWSCITFFIIFVEKVTLATYQSWKTTSLLSLRIQLPLTKAPKSRPFSRYYHSSPQACLTSSFHSLQCCSRRPSVTDQLQAVTASSLLLLILPVLLQVPYLRIYSTKKVSGGLGHCSWYTLSSIVYMTDTFRMHLKGKKEENFQPSST